MATKTSKTTIFIISVNPRSDIIHFVRFKCLEWFEIMLYLIIFYLTVACTQIRTKKVRTKAFTVNNTFGLLAPSFQKFIKRWCNGRQRSVYLFQFSLVFFSLILPQWQRFDTCWMHTIRLIINMSAFTCFSLVVFQKRTSSRWSSVLTPLHPGKQFKSCLVKSKCSLYMMPKNASMMLMHVSSVELGLILKRVKTSVTTGYTSHVCQADFFPFQMNSDKVSHLLYIHGNILVVIYWKPKTIHILSTTNFSNVVIYNTTTYEYINVSTAYTFYFGNHIQKHGQTFMYLLLHSNTIHGKYLYRNCKEHCHLEWHKITVKEYQRINKNV